MSKYNELVKKLKEIFQIDKPELDFGIYRILNMRAKEINDYLDNKLKAKIQAALADVGNANKANLEQQLQAAIKAATDAGFEPEQSPKVQELKKQLAATVSGASEHENAVYSHLLTFFSRYYDNGDFISQRRYKGDTYAIPHAGEEVMLHWANKDQYYIKSGENFANYSFKLADGRKVSFKLLTADTAKDNRKDNEADRRFVLIEPHVRTKVDEEGEEYEQSYNPVEILRRSVIQDGQAVEIEELFIHFEYKAVKKGTKQDALVQDTISKILADSNVQQHWADLANRAPTETKPNRTELERHLTTYTQRNTADYFIHKDLGGFLTNELDFYIKNEVMNLDNLQSAEVFANIEKQLRLIQCFRAVAKELILFLAQVEGFQKRIWEKKKFVISSDYLITTDLIPKEFYPEISNIRKIYDFWLDNGFLRENQKNKNAIEILESGVFVIDTSLLPNELKIKIINAIDGFNDRITGECINSDNFQGLSILSARGRFFDGVYIDPPYNTDGSSILYKNGFRNSSWMSLIEPRLNLVSKLMAEDSAICFAIDDQQINESKMLLKNLFQNDLGTAVVRSNPAGRKTKGKLAPSHEFALFHSSNPNTIPCSLEVSSKKLLRYPNQDEKGQFAWANFIRSGTNDKRFDRPKMHYPIAVDENDNIRIPSLRWRDDEGEFGSYEVLDKRDNETLVYPITQDNVEKRWQRGFERVSQELDQYRVRRVGEGWISIDFKTYMDEASMPITWWDDKLYASANYGAAQLKSLFGSKNFEFPKAVELVKDCLKVIGAGINSKFKVIDFFGGSATTAHSIIELNRSDNGRRTFTLIEQGEYFDHVIKPRIAKAIFTDEHSNGLCLSNKCLENQIVKFVKLESYEDSLNNISLTKSSFVGDLFSQASPELEDDYLIKYMLHSESKGSFLSIKDFSNPFDYKMYIAQDSAGATERKNIDLVDTFNYLIGLHVKSIESNIERGYVRIEGTLPTGERTLVFWRDCDKIGYEELTKYANRFDLYAKEQTFDVIYINGDHNLPTAFTIDTEQGEVTRSLKLRQIEPEFLSLMFAEEA